MGEIQYIFVRWLGKDGLFPKRGAHIDYSLGISTSLCQDCGEAESWKFGHFWDENLGVGADQGQQLKAGSESWIFQLSIGFSNF